MTWYYYADRPSGPSEEIQVMPPGRTKYPEYGFVVKGPDQLEGQLFGYVGIRDLVTPSNSPDVRLIRHPMIPLYGPGQSVRLFGASFVDTSVTLIIRVPRFEYLDGLIVEIYENR